MKVSYLSGPALDWAVAICEGRTDVRVDPDDGELVGQSEFDYSTDWAQGGPIIEREKITVGPYWREESDYCAYWEYPYDDDPPTALGNTPPNCSYALLCSI